MSSFAIGIHYLRPRPRVRPRPARRHGPLARRTSSAREHALAWLSPLPRHQDGTVITRILLCPTEHCSRWSPTLARFPRQRNPRAEAGASDPRQRNPRAESVASDPRQRNPCSESVASDPRQRNPRAESVASDHRQRSPCAESLASDHRQEPLCRVRSALPYARVATTRAGNALQGPLAWQTSSAREPALAWLSPQPRHQDGTVITQILLCPTEHCSRWSPNLARIRVQDSAPTTEC